MFNKNASPFHRRGRDVIERYCSNVGDNVIMVRSHGADDRYTCLSSDLCKGHPKSQTDASPVNSPNCAYMPHGNGIYEPKDNGPIS